MADASRAARVDTPGLHADPALGVSVILPVARDSREFRSALASLRAATPPPDEVIVVVDGPAPAAAQAAKEAGCRVVERSRAGGPAAARNAGARLATSELLLFIDADVAVHPELVARVRAVLADPMVAAAVGCYDAAPPQRNFFSQYKNLLQRFVHLEARREGSTFWGACGAIRRRVLADVGGFDERFRVPSVEDIDLGYRMKAAGHRIVFAAELEVTHLKRWTMASLVRSDVFRRAIPWTWLLMRESTVQADLNLRHRNRAAGVLVAILLLALAGAVVDTRALLVAAAVVSLLVMVDWPLWRFFRARRSAGFAATALAWHWVAYAYSGAALAAGVVLYPVVGRRRVERRGRA